MKRIISIFILICFSSQTIFANSYVGRTKEEAVNKWKIQQEYKQQKSWVEYVNNHRQEILNYVKQENIKYYEPYIVTPVGLIKKGR